jgi:energy-coupling factor transport system substrate-specific component
MKRSVAVMIYVLSAVIGVAAFAYPFILPQTGLAETAHAADAPLLTTFLIVIGLAVLLIEVQGQAVSAKVVAALGVLVAVTAVLRFVEMVFPVIGGFSPIFAPIILAGYVFGARFGFLLGTMALLTSGLVTGNVGPWLPYQMFAAGWVGMSAGWLPRLRGQRSQIVMLAGFGFLWGMLFGIIMNLYFWPFVVDGASTSWQPGSGFVDGAGRYAAFYVATSLIWDLGRALGNLLLILALGMPTVRALARFRDRFQFNVEASRQKAELGTPLSDHSAKELWRAADV